MQLLAALSIAVDFGSREEFGALSRFVERGLTFYGLARGSAGTLPENWRSYPQSGDLGEELKGLLGGRIEKRRDWGIFHPEIHRLGPICAAVFAELKLYPKHVIVVDEPGEGDLGAWLRFTLGCLESVQGAEYVAVPFPTLVADPERWLGWKVELPLTFEGLPFEGSDTFPRLVTRTWEWCKSGRGEAELGAILNEYRGFRAILAPERPGGTKIGFAWKVSGNVRSSQQPFLPSGDWQTLIFPIAAPPGTLINGVLYNKPCRVWIRRAEFRVGDSRFVTKLVPGPGSQLSSVRGVLRLDGAYEAEQVSFATPSEPGPYLLELEILHESGISITDGASIRIASRLHEAAARK